VRGTPAYLRSDNGPEFIAHVVQEWLKQRHSQTAYIERAVHGNMRMEWFRNLQEAQVVIARWRRQGQ
jgi:hypothetical protein